MSMAIYARVSSDRQREEGTIASQVQQLKDFASAQGQRPEERHIYLLTPSWSRIRIVSHASMPTRCCCWRSLPGGK